MSVLRAPLEELRAVDTAARELPLAVPDGYFDSFRGTLRQRLERAHPARRRMAPAWTLAAAAALVLAVLTPRLLREPRVAKAPPAPTRAAPHAAPVRTEDAKVEPTAPPAAARSTREEREDGLAERVGRLAKRDQPAAPTPSVAPPATPAVPPEASEAQAQGYAAAPADADSAGSPPPAQLKAEPEGARELESRPRDELKERRDKAARGGAATEDRAAFSAAGDVRFDGLRRRTVSSAEEARALRDAWRAYARDEDAGPHADEARVRAIEAGALAWRYGKDESDRARAQRDGREYLERPDALQRDRVEGVLRSLSP